MELNLHKIDSPSSGKSLGGSILWKINSVGDHSVEIQFCGDSILWKSGGNMGEIWEKLTNGQGTRCE